MWWVLANAITYFKGEIFYGFEHFVLNIFQITKPQYTDSCTKFQGKTFQDHIFITI